MYSYVKFLFIFLIFIVSYGDCFNIDTDYPIIYFDPNGRNIPKSYFGFSVILYEGINKTKPWIQIGAPRGNASNHYDFVQPGLVYRCPIGKSCNLFHVDMKVNTRPSKATGKGPLAYIPKKDKAWIGATMDIDSEHKRVVVCGPRWINEKREHYIQGACYWSEVGDDNTRELLPLVNTNYEIKDNVYYYPMGQAGMSVHFPKTNPSQIVMGAPGVYNWRGTVISYQDSRLLSTNQNRPLESMFKLNIVQDASKIKDVLSFGYLGYSISSGYFFSSSELSYVAGAPRSFDYKGQVLVFNFGNNKDDIIVKQTRQGATMGEYFGAALGVADINGDRLDDLIVGAPHYASKFDEGRIYIFYGNRRVNLLTPDQSPEITGNYSGGQFGTAIQSLGDIDNDGCEDIAVGAPYEDEHHGVVYIYNGQRKGAPLKLSQRIEGKQLYSSLQGFGISFSRPTDIDNNDFNDIAVGSFLSGNAVILRTRPTVKLNMGVQSLQARLDRNTTQFAIQICFWFSGRNIPSTLRISRKLILDKNHRRIYRDGFSPRLSQEYIDQLEVIHGLMNCNNISIRIKTTQNSKTEWHPIEIIVSQDLVERKINGSPILVKHNVQNVDDDTFCKTCPVVNRFKSIREVKLDVPYALNCGDDNKCNADLKVSAKFLGLTRDKFVIGLYKTIRLEVTVENKKEPAYLTEVEVILPENVYLSAKPPVCDEKTDKNQVSIICAIGNPLEENQMKSITLELDMEAITTLNETKIPFVVMAKSRSDDINPKDNKITKNLTLEIDAKIKIEGKTEKNMYYFGDGLVNATHVYEVHKSGISPLNEFTLNISIPVAYKTADKEIHFLAIHKPRAFQGRQILTCNWPEQFIKDTEVLEVENSNQNISRLKRAVGEESNIRNDTFDFVPIDKILFLNCSMAQVVCKTVSCTVGPFRQSLKDASLQIKIVMNMTEIIQHVLFENESIYLSTDGKVQEIEGPVYRKAVAQVSTAFLKEPEEYKLETWIIIVAVISGILILLLITLGLVKAGFFERKERAELEALKQAEDKSNPKEPTNLCFLDWQLSHVGSPALDLLYFIYACTDKKLRDEHFDQLLKDYYQTLKDFTKELGTDLEKHYSYDILMQQMLKFGGYGLAIAIMLLHLLLSDADEIPDMNEIFDNADGDTNKMMEAFSYESKNVDAYNTRIRDVILHMVEKGFI